jgi:Mg-chelatase subunit ChlD
MINKTTRTGLISVLCCAISWSASDRRVLASEQTGAPAGNAASGSVVSRNVSLRNASSENASVSLRNASSENASVSLRNALAGNASSHNASLGNSWQGETLLAQLHSGTQSTTLESSTQSTTLQSGTQSTTLQSSTQSTTIQGGTQSTTIQGGTKGAMIQGGVEDAGPMNVLIMLDASYSMKEKITGEQKMECAKQVLENAMARIPSDINVGLRVFGQQYTQISELDCHSTALLVPMGTGNRRSIIEQVRQIKPYGLTPLTYALRNAAEDDFRGVKGRKIIILITDGVDTCGENPCAYIAMLPRFGIKIKVDVVGVDLHKDPGARRQLNCIAETSGGKYYDANTAAQMIDSVAASVDKAISGHVIIHPGGNGGAKNTETPPELIPMHATPDSKTIP